MADIPSNLSYGTVYGRFVLAYADSSDDSPYPDALPAAGSLYFTPSPNSIKDATATPTPVTILPATVQVDLDENGYLRSFAGPDGLGVRLLATDDPQGNPIDWTWGVELRLTDQEGTPVRSISSFSFSLPGGTEVDLTSVIPVAASNGTFYVIGPMGPEGASFGDITSNTSNPVSTGIKTFTLNKIGALTVGMRVRLVDTGLVTNYIEGQITDITGLDITVNIVHANGSGTHTFWNVNVTGDRGDQGPPGDITSLEVDSPLTYTDGTVRFDWTATLLDDIGNVSATLPSDADMIKWDTASNLWIKSNLIDGGTA